MWTNGRPLASPKLKRRRALLVLNKIDEILSWEKAKEQERDLRLVGLEQYLCEVQTGRYCRLVNLNSFEEFLEKHFPNSRPKTHYLMAIHEHLPRISKTATQVDGVD